jgi:hypothetical protein
MSTVKIKGKVVSVPMHCAIKTDEGMEVYFHALLISALHGSE